jgi:hypothetical protein
VYTKDVFLQVPLRLQAVDSVVTATKYVGTLAVGCVGTLAVGYVGT